MKKNAFYDNLVNPRNLSRNVCLTLYSLTYLLLILNPFIILGQTRMALQTITTVKPVKTDTLGANFVVRVRQASV